MDDTKYPDSFPPLTIDQIQGLVGSIQDAFGNDFSRAVFTNHLLILFEDVPGYGMGDRDIDRVGPSVRAFGRLGAEELDASEGAYKRELVSRFRDRLEASLKQFLAERTERERIGRDLVALFTEKLSDGKPQNLVWYGYCGPLKRLSDSGKAADIAALTANLLYAKPPKAMRKCRRTKRP